MIAPGAPIAAVTGATGFIGAHLTSALVASGFDVRALVRAPQSPRDKVTWIAGDLATPAALETLVDGAQLVVHLAGAIKGLNDAAFTVVNVDGTRALIDAMLRQDCRRLVHVSTLAARQPSLSAYARSKADAETLVRASGLDWSIIRPPGVYGPGDKETLAFFKAARWPLVPVPQPAQRTAVIHGADLASALIAAADPAMIGHSAEVSDGTDLTLAQLLGQLSKALGTSARTIPLPRPAMLVAAHMAQITAHIRGQAHILTPGKVAELYCPDWSVSDRTLEGRTGWQPRIALADGLAQTARWYQAQGWL